MSAPIMTVVTVVRNAASAIDATVRSVLAQTLAAVEFLVVDGASTDGTAQRLAAFGARVQWSSEADRGIYHAMNKGAARATGTFILFLNAGDHLIDTTILERIAARLTDDVDIVSGRIHLLDAHGMRTGRVLPVGITGWDNLEHYCCIAHPATFVRTTYLRQLGGFDDRLRIAGDYDFWLRAKAAHARIRFIDDVVAEFRAGGLSSTPRVRWEEILVLWRNDALSWPAALARLHRVALQTLNEMRWYRAIVMAWRQVRDQGRTLLR